MNKIRLGVKRARKISRESIMINGKIIIKKKINIKQTKKKNRQLRQLQHQQTFTKKNSIKLQ